MPSSPPDDEDGGRPPLPGLVGIGRDVDDEGTHVLIDLEAAAGPVAVSGERALVMEFLTAAAAELATNGWSGRVAVTCVGLDVGLVDLAPDRVQVAADLDEVLAAFERRHLSDPEPGTDAALTGRLGGRRGALFVSDYLIVARPPTPTQAERLRRLAGRGDLAGVGVLVAGPVAGARWRLEVADTARLPLLGLEVVPQRLTGQTLQRLVALAKTADLEPRPPSTTLTQPHGPEPQTVLRSVGPAQAVEVRILGPLEIAGVALDEARRSARTEEIVTFLALHPDAVTRADLVAALWPGGATDESVMAALQRTTRWLGRDRHTGQPLLEGGDEGPWRLASSVRLDWDLFQSLVVRGGHDDLREALRLVRGGLLAGRPYGRYAWLARMAIEYDAPVLIADTAHRVARVALLRHEVGPAAAAARTGLSVDRDAVALWRDLLDAESRRDPAATRRVADAIRERFGHRLDPATRAALASALGEAASVASTS